MIRPRVACAILITAALLPGCRGTTPAPTTTAPDVAPRSHLEVHWVRDSAEYRALLIQTWRLAGERLEELAAGREPGTWAVALDADETVVDNSRYQVELVEKGEGYRPETFDAFVLRRESPPTPGAVGFLARVHELGGKIAIVTNRRQPTCADTETNFRKYSIPYDVILCRVADREKEPRWQQVEDGGASPDLPPLDIVMWIGDNVEDFPDLDQELRFEDEAAFSAFGAEYFLIPNPMYGSWERNPEK